MCSARTLSLAVIPARNEKWNTHVEASKERRGIRGGPGRGRLISGPVAQLMLIIGKDLLVSTGLSSISRHWYLHFSVFPIKGPIRLMPQPHILVPCFVTLNLLKDPSNGDERAGEKEHEARSFSSLQCFPSNQFSDPPAFSLPSLSPPLMLPPY